MELKRINKKWPKLTKLYSLSEKSVDQRNLWVLQISKNVHMEKREELKPMVKYVGNMHGNEVVGRELLLTLADYLLQRYTSSDENDEVKQLIDTTDIHILPSMNPDGFEHAESKCTGVIGITHIQYDIRVFQYSSIM